MKQKVTILMWAILSLFTFLVPPCYVNYNNKMISIGYRIFAIFKGSSTNIVFIHTPTFYAQLITFFIVTLALVVVLKK